MALKFSKTFLFKNPVTLDQLRDLYESDNESLVLQSPSTVPFPIVEKLVSLGGTDE